mmetsp:Transcript_32380/g.52476  ORF Transcript_32380/g.52476 Transcript_32380/m.52476 type:complete len:451 (+) Transcript_32380:137-1489(+)
MTAASYLRASLIGLYCASVAFGDAKLTSPNARTKAKWTGNTKIYTYSSYAAPTNGIQGCGVGSTVPMCQTLETCDDTSQGALTAVTRGGFLTVDWECSTTGTHTQADDSGANTGVTIAIKCGAGSQDSFFQSGHVLSQHFNAGCANTTSGTLTVNNAVTIPESFEGNCVVLWAWETQQGVTGNGFYMGCADVQIQQGNFAGGSIDSVTKEDYDKQAASAAVIIPILFILACGVVSWCYRKSLPDWFPFVRYAVLGFFSLVGFGTGIVINNFEEDGENPLATSDVRFGTTILFFTFLYSALLCVQLKLGLFLDMPFLNFFVCALMIVLAFVAGSVSVLEWEGKDEYCTYSDSDDKMCNNYKMFIVALWMVFSLLLVELGLFVGSIFTGEKRQRIGQTDDTAPRRSWGKQRNRRRSSIIKGRGNVSSKKQFYEMNSEERVNENKTAAVVDAL